MGLQAAMVGLPAPQAGQVVDMRQEGDRYVADRIHYDYSPESPPVVVFAMPTLVQCKKIFWKPLLNLLTNHPTVQAINKAECTIKFKQPKDDVFYRPDIICIGLNDADGDRARGLRIGHINCDEFQDIKRGVFDEVIVPALADTPGSTALITLTPKGKVNHGYEFFRRAEEFPEDYKSFHFITTDNDKLPASAIREIERSRKILAPRVYRQEHEASFEDFPGQIFDHLDDHHLVSEVPSSFVRVVLGVDWGDVNPALVAVGVTRENGEDCYWVLETWNSDSGNNVLPSTHQGEAERLIKAYGIGFVYCGHDRPASIREWGDRFRPLGVIVKQAFNAISEGNNAVNGMLANNRLWLRSPHCKEFKEQMASYHRKQDKATGKFLDEPAEGQIDHLVDSLRYGVATDIYKPAIPPKRHQARSASNV